MSRLVSVMDVYILRSTLGGFGRRRRKVFSVLERKEKDEKTQTEKVVEVFLIEGEFDVLNNSHTGQIIVFIYGQVFNNIFFFT